MKYCKNARYILAILATWIRAVADPICRGVQHAIVHQEAFWSLTNNRTTALLDQESDDE
jgi:hypothetical protein